MKKKEEAGNRIMPCIIRDHHEIFNNIIKRHPVKPIDEPAKEALKSSAYHNHMIEYDKKVAKLLDAEWEKDFVRPDLELIKHSPK